MIQFEVSLQGSTVHAFRVTGHAGYAEHGEDIVCAAVSTLVYNAVNSCECLASAKLETADVKDVFECKVPRRYLGDDRVQLLLSSLVFGIEQIAQTYPKFVRVHHR